MMGMENSNHNGNDSPNRTKRKRVRRQKRQRALSRFAGRQAKLLQGLLTRHRRLPAQDDLESSRRVQYASDTDDELERNGSRQRQMLSKQAPEQSNRDITAFHDRDSVRDRDQRPVKTLRSSLLSAPATTDTLEGTTGKASLGIVSSSSVATNSTDRTNATFPFRPTFSDCTLPELPPPPRRRREGPNDPRQGLDDTPPLSEVEVQSQRRRSTLLATRRDGPSSAYQTVLENAVVGNDDYLLDLLEGGLGNPGKNTMTIQHQHHHEHEQQQQQRIQTEWSRWETWGWWTQSQLRRPITYAVLLVWIVCALSLLVEPVVMPLLWIDCVFVAGMAGWLIRQDCILRQLPGIRRDRFRLDRAREALRTANSHMRSRLMAEQAHVDRLQRTTQQQQTQMGIVSNDKSTSGNRRTVSHVLAVWQRRQEYLDAIREAQRRQVLVVLSQTLVLSNPRHHQQQDNQGKQKTQHNNRHVLNRIGVDLLIRRLQRVPGVSVREKQLRGVFAQHGPTSKAMMTLYRMAMKEQGDSTDLFVYDPMSVQTNDDVRKGKNPQGAALSPPRTPRRKFFGLRKSKQEEQQQPSVVGAPKQ